MNRVCPCCDKKLQMKFLFKQKNTNTVTCPFCQNKLYRTRLSTLIFMLVIVIPLIMISTLVEGILDFLLSVSWIFLSVFIIQPLTYQYKSTCDKSRKNS